MENLPKREFNLVRQDALSEALLVEAMRATKDYSLSLISGNELIGSGTLVSVGSCYGILTADHVWRTMLRDGRLDHFALVVGSMVHRFQWRFDECKPFVIGAHSLSHEAAGPDLAFIRLDNPLKIATLKSLKSFYHLSGGVGQMFDQIPHKRCPWIITGAPAEKTLKILTPTGEPVSKVTQLAGVSQFIDLEERGGYDYVTVRIPAGQGEFPSDFGGVSGGGAWIPFQLSGDPNGTALKPMIFTLLVGVAYYQQENEPGWKTLTLHGPKSIYERVTQSVSAECPPHA
jgi:hypothetical protein